MVENDREPILFEWNFGDDSILAEKLKELVLSGKKSATTGLHRKDKEIPHAGDHAAILNTNGKRFCIVQYTKITIKPFLDVDYEYVQKEGEGHETIGAWREDHRFFLKGYPTSSMIMF